MDNNNFNWNDLRYFLELSRSKKMVDAAPKLGVEYTTVSRRILELESRIGSKLFYQTKSGYQLTDAGTALVIYAEKIEALTQSITNDIAGVDFQTTGSIRLGATEGLGVYFLAKNLSKIHEETPGLTIDLMALPRFVNLADHEADIAITIERPKTGRYIAAKLTDYKLSLVASKEYIKNKPKILSASDLVEHPFVGYIDDLLYSEELRYLDEFIGANQKFCMKSNSLSAQYQSIKYGNGIGILPNFMTVDKDDFVKILPNEISLTRSFWLITREDSYNLSRIKYVWSFIRKTVEEQKSIF